MYILFKCEIQSLKAEVLLFPLLDLKIAQELVNYSFVAQFKLSLHNLRR